MSWLWGGRKTGDIVDLVTALIRVAPAAGEERKHVLEQVRDMSAAQENHEVIGKALASLLALLRPAPQQPKDVEAMRLALEILTNIMKLPEEVRRSLLLPCCLALAGHHSQP